MQQAHRIRKQGHFRYVYRRGKRASGALMTAYFVKAGRLQGGFSVSRKVGNAVTRNRAKRRLRALAVQTLPRLGHPGWDYVLVGRPGATVDRPFAALLDDLEGALRSIHKPCAPRP